MTIRQFIRSTFLSIALSLSAFAATDRNYTTTPVMSQETRALVQMLDLYHYNKDALGQNQYTQLISEFMADLDPTHLPTHRELSRRLHDACGWRIETVPGLIPAADFFTL